MAFFWFCLTVLSALVSPLVLFLSASAYDLADVLAGYSLQNDSNLGLGFPKNETEFYIMTNMLLVAGLAGMEASDVESECTILAPSDESFYRTARDLGLDASSKMDLYRAFLLFITERYEDPISTLRQQLLFHVLPQKLQILPHDTSNSAQFEGLDALLQEKGVYRINMTLIDGNPDLPDPNVIFELSNVQVFNCYIHVLDRLLFAEPLVLAMNPDASWEPSYASWEPSMVPEPTTETAAESSYEPRPLPEIDASGDPEESTQLFSVYESPAEPLPPTVWTATKTPHPSSAFTPSPIDMEETASSAPMPSWDVPSPSSFAMYTPVESSQVQMEEEFYHLTTPEVSPLAEVRNEPSLPHGGENLDELETRPTQSPEGGDSPTASINVALDPSAGFSSSGPVAADSIPTETLAPHIFNAETSAAPSLIFLDPSPSPAFSHEGFMEEDLVPSESLGPELLPSEKLLKSSAADAEDFAPAKETEGAYPTPVEDFPATESTSENENMECFPLSANFHLPTGEAIKFAHLDAGFDVLVTESSVSKVYLFTHRKTNGMHDFVQIRSNKNHSIVLSQGHYIHANNELKAAGHVEVGDTLRTLDGRAVVTSVEWTRDYGLIAPHTLHGDIVVNRVVVSTYTSAVNPRLAHILLWPLRALVEIGAAVEPMGSLLYDGLPEFVPNTHRFIRLLRGRGH